jgi:hypothetical protein
MIAVYETLLPGHMNAVLKTDSAKRDKVGDFDDLTPK